MPSELEIIDSILNPIQGDFDSCDGLNVSNIQKHFVSSFGYEIEGGFADYDEIEGECNCDLDCDGNGCECANNPRNSKYFKHDGSVETNHYTAGEIASPVFYIQTKRDLSRFNRFVKEHFPQEVNKTCGLHIHLGLNNLLSYAKLMEIEFFKEFKLEVDRFFHSERILFEDHDLIERYEERFANENDYCKSYFCPNSQANQGYYEFDGSGSGRYTFLNFCFQTHKTIECRLFPACNNPDQVICIVEWFIKFTNSYLKTVEKRERAEKHKVLVNEVTEIIYHETELYEDDMFILPESRLI